MSAGFTDTIQNFLKSASDRINNPFIFSFCVSFLIVHFDAFLYLILSDDYVNERIRVFYELLGKNEKTLQISSTLDSIFLPLILASAYTFGWPYIDKIIELFRAKSGIYLNDKISDILKTKTYSYEDVEKLIEQKDTAIKRTVEQEATIDNNTQTLSRNRQLIAERDEQVESLKADNEQIKSKLNSNSDRISILMKKNGELLDNNKRLTEIASDYEKKNLKVFDDIGRLKKELEIEKERAILNHSIPFEFPNEKFSPKESSNTVELMEHAIKIIRNIFIRSVGIFIFKTQKEPLIREFFIENLLNLSQETLDKEFPKGDYMRDYSWELMEETVPKFIVYSTRKFMSERAINNANNITLVKNHIDRSLKLIESVPLVDVLEYINKCINFDNYSNSQSSPDSD